MSSPLSNLRSPVSLARFLGTTAVGLALDQWTKIVAFERLSRSESYPFIPGWLHFRITENPGAVFGLGAGHWMVFVAVSLVAIVFIGYLFATSGQRWGYQIILGMLLAGVLGNMYDRIRFGKVRDMIYAFPDRHIFGHEVFPWIFNVADTLLCVGVGLIMLYSFLQAREAATQTTAKPAGDRPAPSSAA